MKDKYSFFQFGDLFLEANCILEERRQKLDLLKPQSDSDSESIEAQDALCTFYAMSLDVYIQINRFIAKRLRGADHEEAYFIIPSIRQLLDIYVRFLHLMEIRDLLDRALPCVALQLKTYRSAGMREAYDQAVSLNSHLLTKKQFPFFEYDSFDYYKYAHNAALSFGKTEKLFHVDIVHKYSKPPIQLFKGERIVQIHRHFSEIIHANPYFFRSLKKKEGYWLMSMGTMVTSYVIELLDVHILKQGLQDDFSTWLQKAQTASVAMIGIWKNK